MLLSNAAFPMFGIRVPMPGAVGTMGVRGVKVPMAENPGLPMARGVSMVMPVPDIMDRFGRDPMPEKIHSSVYVTVSHIIAFMFYSCRSNATPYCNQRGR